MPNITFGFTEPDFPYLDALAPFQPLAMKAVHCPIDTSLNFTQANKLIRDLKPEHLVIPECYTQPPLTALHRMDLVIEPVGVCITFYLAEETLQSVVKSTCNVFIVTGKTANYIQTGRGDKVAVKEEKGPRVH